MPSENVIQRAEALRHLLLTQAAGLANSLAEGTLPFWLNKTTAEFNLNAKRTHAARLERLIVRWRSEGWLFRCQTITGHDNETCGSTDTKVLVITKRLCVYHCNVCRMNSIEVF